MAESSVSKGFGMGCGCFLFILVLVGLCFLIPTCGVVGLIGLGSQVKSTFPTNDLAPHSEPAPSPQPPPIVTNASPESVPVTPTAPSPSPVVTNAPPTPQASIPESPAPPAPPALTDADFKGTADLNFDKTWVYVDGVKIGGITSATSAPNAQVSILYSNGGKTVPAKTLPQGFLDAWHLTPEVLKSAGTQ